MARNAKPTVNQLIQQLSLSQDVLGGFTAKTFPPSEGEGESGSAESLSTNYFLLQTGHACRLHREHRYQVLHFYMGEPLTVSVSSTCLHQHGKFSTKKKKKDAELIVQLLKSCAGG